MTEPMPTNEMKRHVVIIALKADHRDLEIATFLRVTRLFIRKIRKELEKENDNPCLYQKRKRPSTRSDSPTTPKFIHKVKQTIDEYRGQSIGQLQKSQKCL